MNAVDYFSATVNEADRKFTNACSKHACFPQFHENAVKGPNSEALNIGVCRVGPADASNCLLIVSGTHGIEGYAGAGIQTGWLSQLGGNDLPDDTSIVMVHMLNPWGMAWNRRENEDNVDLFRNLIYCDHRSTPDPLYDLVDDFLNLENWSGRDQCTWEAQAEELAAKYGRDRLISAIRRGQHHRPQSMTFHGNGPTWSKLCFDQLVTDNCQGARRIAVIDIHTGFGDYGQGIVMSYDSPESAPHKRVSEWFSGAIYSPGSDATIPTHNDRFPFRWIESLVADSRVTAEILEFGTFDPAEIGEVYNANHHFHVYGDPLSEEGRKWGREYRHYCYPEEDDWKNLVWQRGCEVIEKTLVGLGHWSTEND